MPALPALQVDHQASELQSLREKNEELSEAVDQYNLQQKVSRTAGPRALDCFFFVRRLFFVVPRWTRPRIFVWIYADTEI